MQYEKATEGIRVQVRPRFSLADSDPADGTFVFSYEISMENEGKSPAQLLFRHWRIHDSAGDDSVVDGEKVVQTALDTTHHLIVVHDVISVGSDRGQLARISGKAKAALGAERLDVVADRGYFDSEEILACGRAGITVTLPKPLTLGAKAQGRFGKQVFRYDADDDVYICPAGERLAYRITHEVNGLAIRRYWTSPCTACALKAQSTPRQTAPRQPLGA